MMWSRHKQTEIDIFDLGSTLSLLISKKRDVTYETPSDPKYFQGTPTTSHIRLDLMRSRIRPWCVLF
jgi:hypothetical protein